MSTKNLTLSYLSLRRCIGLLAILHPAILYFGGLWIFGLGLQKSMSHYYYTPMRDVFVGVDFAIGVFLLTYRGYGTIDRVTAAIAGCAAIVAALFPTGNEGSPDSVGQTIAAIHAGAALIFLAALAFFCLVLFVRTAPGQVPDAQKRARNVVYRLCGWNIVLVILVVLLYGAVPGFKQGVANFPFIFSLEVFAFVSFGISWLVKGKALIPDEK